ncbi:hypothetical protein MMB17_12160 [Methylobacterium organophilum]|uniref:hypothetical protein n=1 Tax=Methylobacterium organophilum TaxID=410 RepID=UPI001F13B078|nr:hypothetical protein [Methylobacterium organophilum]UMY15521.1 hypothetical protein MMB17_12160 [Methylobacterium organophilum]
MRSYNLFRRKGGESLCCAVPESHAVPRFVTGGRWTFEGRVEEAAGVPRGFDGKAAATGVRFNGFYLFQAVDRRFG